MEWKQFFATAVIIALIVIMQWPSIKSNPTKDKGAFIVLLLIVLVLSLFNLQYVKGPSDLEQAIFSPISRMIGK